MRPFPVNAPRGLQHQSREVEVGPLKAGVILTVLAALGVQLAGLLDREAAPVEGASDRHIDGQAPALTPKRNGDVARTPTRGGAKDALLLHDGREETLRRKPVYQVADAVVPDEGIACLAAA